VTKGTRQASARERLLEATLELLAERGPGVSVDEIARRAKVAKGTIYYHFGGKRKLLEEALKAEIQRVGRSLGSASPWKAEPEVQLAQALQGLAHWATQRPKGLRALLWAWQPGLDLHAQARGRLQRQLIRHLSETLLLAQAAKLIDPSWPTELLAVALYGALGHVIEHLKRRGEPLDLDPKRLADALLAFLLRRPLPPA